MRRHMGQKRAMTIPSTSDAEQGNTSHLVYQGEACPISSYIRGSRSSKIICGVSQCWSEGVVSDRYAAGDGD